MSNVVKEEYIKDFYKTEKLGVVATLDESGYPRLSLLTTLMAADEKRMVVGQFSQGISKKNMQVRHKTGFAVVSLDMHFWTGRMTWTGKTTEGPEYIKYNQMQMWRFNTYFGIDTVHYFDLLDISEKAKLDLVGIGVSAVKEILLKGKFKSGRKETVMRPFGEKLFNGLANPKFISFVDGDGYPCVVPVVQAQSAGSDRIIFAVKPYGDMLAGLAEGAKVAVLAASMQMESLLVQGTFKGYKNGIGLVEIEQVYNSMPPVCRYIYPYQDFSEVTQF